MEDATLKDLRDHLGRDPTPMERVTWSQRQRKGGNGPTLEQNRRGTARNLLKLDTWSREKLVERFERDRDNLHVPPNVGSGLPMDEDEVRAVYDRVISDLKAGEIST